MNKSTQLIVSAITFVLCAVHIYLFVSGISLSEEINKYESGIKKLQHENIDLEKKLYEVESLSHAASAAASMNFTSKAVPVYLDNLNIALNR